MALVDILIAVIAPGMDRGPTVNTTALVLHLATLGLPIALIIIPRAGPWRRGIIMGMVLAVGLGWVIAGLFAPLPVGPWDYGAR